MSCCSRFFSHPQAKKEKKSRATDCRARDYVRRPLPLSLFLLYLHSHNAQSQLPLVHFLPAFTRKIPSFLLFMHVALKCMRETSQVVFFRKFASRRRRHSFTTSCMLWGYEAGFGSIRVFSPVTHHPGRPHGAKVGLRQGRFSSPLFSF